MITALQKPIVFCDVETTGGSPQRDRITEIACIRYENGVETARFTSLINPRTHIPYNIQILTNITNAMTDAAPAFEDVAGTVAELFEGAYLCAHNARFDYSFIKAELARSELPFAPKQICTAKLSRSLYPNERSHNLSAIIDRFGLSCPERHRALSDTLALVQFANHIQRNFGADTITDAVLGQKGRFTPPPNLDPDVVNELPDTPGVYSFIGKDGEILYIGKSKHIRTRVMSHFANANREGRARAIWQETYGIEFETTASDFSAQLLEIFKIKQEMPVYNKRLRKNERLWVLEKTDDLPYLRFRLTPLNNKGSFDYSRIFAVFKTKSQAKKTLLTLAKEYRFCPILLGIETGRGPCFSHQLDLCSGACCGRPDADAFNQAILDVFAKRKLRGWPYQKPLEIIKATPERDRFERFVIDNWVLTSATILEEGQDEPYHFFATTPTFFDYDIYKVLIRELL